MKLKKIKFICNWNKKLDCNFYTTIRMIQNGNDSYWKKKDIIEVYIKDKFIHEAEILDVMKCELKNIPNYLCLLDSGMSLISFCEFCSKIYKMSIDVVNNQQFMIIVIKKLNKK